MPRKTEASSASCGRATRFNEAAARCRGKRLRQVQRGVPGGVASMRPRPDAAENVLHAGPRSYETDVLQ